MIFSVVGFGIFEQKDLGFNLNKFYKLRIYTMLNIPRKGHTDSDWNIFGHLNWHLNRKGHTDCDWNTIGHLIRQFEVKSTEKHDFQRQATNSFCCEPLYAHLTNTHLRIPHIRWFSQSLNRIQLCWSAVEFVIRWLACLTCCRHRLGLPWPSSPSIILFLVLSVSNRNLKAESSTWFLCCMIHLSC